MATRLQIRDLVIENTGRSDKASLINSAIDIALEEISAGHLWSDLLVEATATLAVAAGSVTLATDLRRLTEIRVLDGTSSRPILMRKKTWLLQKFPNPSASSNAKPVYGYLEGTTLNVIPEADVQYPLEYTYYRTHPALAADGDSPLIRNISTTVIAYASFWVWNAIEREAEAKRWFLTYQTLFRSARELDRADSAVKIEAEQRGQFRDVSAPVEYWLDPFARSAP